MCGLVGILRRDGEPADARILGRMLSPMLHRGPDGRGTWAENEVALGHLRLSILDLSERASQPITSAGGEGVLVYNGEVYNYRALRSELEREGAVFASSGDTEVVLQALLRWGPERAIPRFNGMFALAYFDRRSRELWLARDRLGIKPLYVAERRRRADLRLRAPGAAGAPVACPASRTGSRSRPSCCAGARARA